jgi:HCOMODA/2-hydroxy-3-carboxy-muconic semialdehyde decarboxylase
LPVTGSSTVERARRDLTTARQILAMCEVVDVHGHVSVRHPETPDRYLISIASSSGAGEIAEYTISGDAVGDDRADFPERHVHGAIYEARPDVAAVIRAHTEAVLPFSLSETPLRPVIHSASGMGHRIPVWKGTGVGEDTDATVLSMDQGRDLARCLAGNTVVLMRGQGFAAAGGSLLLLVMMAVYLPRNAKVLLDGLRIGDLKYLSEGEVAARASVDPNSPAMRRAWDYWAIKAGCRDPLVD